MDGSAQAPVHRFLRDWTLSYWGGMTACGRFCCKTIFEPATRNIDSRMSQTAQYRIRDACFSDSIIACWQRSKEFCNNIGPKRRFGNVCFSAAYGRKAEVLATFNKRRF
jgi:hypothetical protein